MVGKRIHPEPGRIPLVGEHWAYEDVYHYTVTKVVPARMPNWVKLWILGKDMLSAQDYPYHIWNDCGSWVVVTGLECAVCLSRIWELDYLCDSCRLSDHRVLTRSSDAH